MSTNRIRRDCTFSLRWSDFFNGFSSPICVQLLCNTPKTPITFNILAFNYFIIVSRNFFQKKIHNSHIVADEVGRQHFSNTSAIMSAPITCITRYTLFNGHKYCYCYYRFVCVHVPPSSFYTLTLHLAVFTPIVHSA